jgi:class 3 adenylate cyclase
MARISLKSIVGKKNDTGIVVASLINQIGANVWIEDETGKILSGEEQPTSKEQHPVVLDDEFIGWVKGDEKAYMVATLLSHLAQKETEKKKLGSEVLNLYQEINLIFNFSEKLAQTIDATTIAQITLSEARHVINSQYGVVVLWDESDKRLEVVASEGDLFVNEEKINYQMPQLLKILLNGQSEILNDIPSLIEEGVILSDVQSVIYAALKVKHRVMGAIVLASTEPVLYTAADLKLLTTLALQSSGAIESALLYEKNIREAREKEEAMRHIYETAEKFVPYEFIRSLGHEKITDVKLGDQVEKIVTVLFSDIRNYTTISEQMTPEENFHFVCSFNEHLGPIIRRHYGFINQYLGDAIMAIFPRNATDALSAAIEIQKEVEAFNQERQLIDQRTIQIGVGMHTGPLIMGITGDKNRLDATTISDTVNTASRIEGLTKNYKAGILISEATLQQIEDRQPFHLRYLGAAQLKGKQASIPIYECFNSNSEQQVQNKLATLSEFNEGIRHYLNRSFEEAKCAFENVVEANPNDTTANFFHDKVLEYTKMRADWKEIEELNG